MAWIPCQKAKPDKVVAINSSVNLTYYENSQWGANPAYLTPTIDCTGYKYAYVECQITPRNQYNNTAGGVSNTISIGIGNTSHMASMGTVSGAPSGGGMPTSYPVGKLTKKVDISSLTGNQSILAYQSNYSWAGGVDSTITVYNIRLSNS